ncbi:ImmA/IrrE family metallo-endopeptidase [Candidatus Parcubacteria bacterium]|nr:ImmA/IrrE family metallo-endopeptidase [Candidatus Parcubacteria bacterium]
MYKKAKQQINKILKKYNFVEPPIPIEKIMDDYDIITNFAPDDIYSGIIIKKKDGRVLVGINSNDPPTRQRFSLAHELSHFLLNNEKVFVDHRDNITFDYESHRSEKEQVANFFAANLLMPEKMIENVFNKIIKNKKYFLEEDITGMADLFKVSREAMNYRLDNLGLISRNIK